MAKNNKEISRRDFLKVATLGVAGLVTGCDLFKGGPAPTPTASVADSLNRMSDILAGFGQRLSGAETRAAVTPTLLPTATPTATTAAEATATRGAARAATAVATKPSMIVNAPMQETFRKADALNYPGLIIPNPAREPAFPDVPQNGHGPLAAYEKPFANADYFHDGKGEVSVPQYYYRLITGRRIVIPELGVDVASSGRKGALVLLINHFGETATYKNSIAENSFTVAGRVFDMGMPEKVTLAAQALLDHQVGRMVNSPDGANCSVIDACKQVEWRVVVVGGGKAQRGWAGLYTK